MNMIIFLSFLVNQIQLNLGQENNHLQNVWDFIKNTGTENCPRCNSVPECYAECDQDQMREFTGISNWANCKDKCLSLGDLFAYEFDNTFQSDRACAMYSQKDLSKCVCVRGNRMACKDIAGGNQNCPNCGTFWGTGAPECLAECDRDHWRVFRDIADWDDCKDKCKSLGDPFTYKWGTWNSNRGCAIYAKYDNMGNQGKCVCVEGKNYACDNTEFFDAPPAILPPDVDTPPQLPAPETNTISYEMIEGYGIGVISTVVILLVGLLVACIYRWKYTSKPYGKSVGYIDSEDERIVINS